MSQTPLYFQYYSATDRIPLVKGCDISHYQYTPNTDDPPINWATMKTQGDYVHMKAGGQYASNFSCKYMKISCNGSHTNVSSIFNEFQAFYGSTDAVLTATLTSSQTPDVGTLENIRDTATGHLGTYVIVGSNAQWIKCEFTALRSISYVVLQLYYADARIFKDVKIEYSTDDITYTTLYSSAIAGEKAEKLGGMGIFKYGGMSVDSTNTLAHVTAARAAGLKIGFTWFNNPNYYDSIHGWLCTIPNAETQATTFYNYIVAVTGSADDIGDIMPMFDFENQNGAIYPAMTNDQAYDFVAAFIAKFKELSGRQCILYTAFNCVDNLTTQPQELYHSTKGGIGAVCPLMLASYATSYPAYAFTAFGIFTNNKWTNWQFQSSGGHGAAWGVHSAEIDLDVLEGNLYTIMPPTQPINLVATAGDGQVVLTWTQIPDTDKTNYNIYKCVTGGTPTYYNFMSSATSTFTVTGLTNTVSYDFTVAGVDRWEIGVQSAIATAIPLASAAPDGLELAGDLLTESTMTGYLYKALKTGLSVYPTEMFEFSGKLYILTGVEYLVYTTGGAAISVAGYVPKLAIACLPIGGVGTVDGDGKGRLYEQINVLTGKKRQTFSPDGTSKDFYVLEQSLTSIDLVQVNGVTVAETTDYIVHLTEGYIHFNTAPITGTPSNVEIWWTKGTGTPMSVRNNRFEMEYSGQTDSRVFLWGNQNLKNRRIWSGLADGVPSAEYFEANSFDDLGTGEFAITDIVKQYDRQKIFFEQDGGSMYSYYSADTDVSGNTLVSFPVFELNDNIGNAAFHQVQVVNNNPYSLNHGIYAWKVSLVRDQTNASLISERVKASLDLVDLTTAVTYNWQEQKEYWCNIGSIVWVYNYLNSTWYKYDNIAAKMFYTIGGEMYFGTADGKIQKFEEDLRNDNGVAIPVSWEMGFFDFGSEWRLKYINRAWVAINSSYRSSLNVAYVTNVDGGVLNASQLISFNILTFKHINFDHFSFQTSYNPQPFAIEIDVQRFIYFKFILSKTDAATTVTVLSINMQGRLGGKL
jgi:hypothetical protein